MSHYQISGRQYYIVSLVLVVTILVLAAIFGWLNQKSKADVNVTPHHLPDVQLIR